MVGCLVLKAYCQEVSCLIARDIFFDYSFPSDGVLPLRLTICPLFMQSLERF